jgi:uncharacterized protein
MIPRVVLDTNIVISGTFWGNQPKEVLVRAIAGEAQLLTTVDILTELRRVLGYAKFDGRFHQLNKTLDQTIADYEQACELVLPVEVPLGVVRDDKDLMILGCAEGGLADYIVSGDKDLTDLKTYKSIPIITPVAFLMILNENV